MTRQSDPDLERVVVGIDFSEPSLRAARWVAQRFAPGAQLILVHVVHLPPARLSLADRSTRRERLIETARAGAELRLRQLSDSIATGLVWIEVRVGQPSGEIVRVAEEYGADLIVVGRPEGREGGRGGVDTTAQRVLRRSKVPVLLARERTSAKLNVSDPQLLVAVDDSDMTTAVLAWGRSLAERLSVHATVLHALDGTHYSSVATPADPLAWAELYSPRYGPPSVVTEVRDAERWLSERVRAIDDGGRMTPVVIGRLTPPADVILAEAEQRDAELIVLGSRGAGTVSRLLFGSVAESVLLGASCPVLVVTSSLADTRVERGPNALHAGAT
jgi:nucleotide-binding universal stress UspA family protein